MKGKAMIFNVNARYSVQYLSDRSETFGEKYTRHMRVEGQIEAESEEQAKAQVENAIRSRHVPCWALAINEIALSNPNQ